MPTAAFRLFFDMDGVLVDFDAFMRKHGLSGDEVKKLPGAYREMRPIFGALDGIRKVMSLAGQYGGEVWLATKPPTGIPFACADKVSWVLTHLPELKRRIIITHDKGLLGCADDFLIDDRPHRANCADFRGTLVHFGPTGTVPHWSALADLLHRSMAAKFPRLQDGKLAPIAGTVAPLRSPGQVGGSPCAPIQAAVGRAEMHSGATIEDINAARGLMRLGPIVTQPAHGGYPDAADRAGRGLVRESTPTGRDIL